MAEFVVEKLKGSAVVVLLFWMLGPMASAQNSEQSIPFERPSGLSCGGPEQRTMSVIRSELGMRRLVRKSRGSKIGSPKVDFRKQMLIVIFQGTQPSSGYGIRVTELIETSNALRVLIEETAPGKSCNVLDAVTHPCDLIVTKRVHKRVVFEINRRTTDCR